MILFLILQLFHEYTLIKSIKYLDYKELIHRYLNGLILYKLLDAARNKQKKWSFLRTWFFYWVNRNIFRWKLSATTYKFRQIPLFFTNPCADNLSKTLTSFGSQQPYRVVYMGARYTPNFKAFKSYSRQDSFEESICKFQTEMYG